MQDSRTIYLPPHRPQKAESRKEIEMQKNAESWGIFHTSTYFNCLLPGVWSMLCMYILD